MRLFTACRQIVRLALPAGGKTFNFPDLARQILARYDIIVQGCVKALLEIVLEAHWNPSSVIMFTRSPISSVSLDSYMVVPHLLITLEAFKQISRPSRSLPAKCLRQQQQIARITPLQLRLLSTETKAAIDKAVGSAPVVLFMKGTPETPQ